MHFVSADSSDNYRSCGQNSELVFIAAVTVGKSSVFRCPHLCALCRQVHHCVVDSMSGVAAAITWLIEQSQRSWRNKKEDRPLSTNHAMIIRNPHIIMLSRSRMKGSVEIA